MRIIIQGAGIGGLTLGALLNEHEVTVLEKRDEVKGVGAGLLLHDESLAVLSSINVKPEGRRFERFNIGFCDGRLLPPGRKQGLAITRKDLHESLVQANSCNEIRISSSVVSFTEAVDGVSMKLSDGTELEADYLIGADGIGSGIRSLHNCSSSRVFAGSTCWRGITKQDPKVNQPIELWGDGIRIGVIPLKKGAYLYITDSRVEAGDVSNVLLSQFKNYPYEIYDLVKSVSEQDWMQHDLEELDKHFWGSNRVPMLGDAAHAFTPNLGEGAAQAILDANYLAECLKNTGSYPSVRNKKNRQLARLSRYMGYIAQAKGVKATIRNLVFYVAASRKRRA